MNWYKKAQDNSSNIPTQLSLLDTRGKKDKAKANEIILKFLNIKCGDILKSTTGMSSGIDKNYKVQSINQDFSVNLFAIESGREMSNVNLYDFAKHNMPAWEKNELV
jgi:hypothetical protein